MAMMNAELLNFLAVKKDIINNPKQIKIIPRIPINGQGVKTSTKESGSDATNQTTKDLQAIKTILGHGQLLQRYLEEEIAHPRTLIKTFKRQRQEVYMGQGTARCI